MAVFHPIFQCFESNFKDTDVVNFALVHFLTISNMFSNYPLIDFSSNEVAR